MHKLNELLSRTPGWERRFARKFQIQAVARMNELLAQSPLDQKGLAEKAGWDKSYVSRLLSGSGGNLTLKTISRFEDALGADVLAVTTSERPAPVRHWVQPSAGAPVIGESVTRTVLGMRPQTVTVYAGSHE